MRPTGFWSIRPAIFNTPSPVEVDRIGKAAGPGALIATEREFIAKLIRHLDPFHAENDQVIKRIPETIKRGQREYYLLRNLDRSPDGTRLRLADENWFYPDFIFWIIDKATKPETQRLCYLDPKGLEKGMRGGWNHHKVLCFAYKVFPNVDDFAKAGIFFAEKTDHIELLMAYLLEDKSLLDQVMRRAAVAENLPEDALPDEEIGCFYRYLLRKNPDKRIALGELVRHALTASDLNRVIARLQGESRKQLTPYLTRGVIHKMTGGMEDVNRIAQPCRELLRRCAA